MRSFELGTMTELLTNDVKPTSITYLPVMLSTHTVALAASAFDLRLAVCGENCCLTWQRALGNLRA